MQKCLPRLVIKENIEWIGARSLYCLFLCINLIFMFIYHDNVSGIYSKKNHNPGLSPTVLVLKKQDRF